ncbi:MAG: 4Fe-4S binding protein [Candidatus Omnitrophica bacterium]|nr:4Fe-4S binding protein [Candidatus Omnitrophota bacterium]
MNTRIILQAIMVWFLPLLGYLVFFMMLFFLSLSYFKGRFWCSRLCPRGAFLDLILSKFSLRNKIPKIFLKFWFKWLFFALFMAFFVLQLILSQKTPVAIGFVFVRMCIITTIIAVILGIPLRERSWCAICPMGTLQAKIGSLKRHNN